MVLGKAFLLPLSLAGRISVSKLIQHFPSHPVAFGFQASTLPDNFIIDTANKKTDQSLSDFQTCTDDVALATLEMGQLISHMGSAIINTTTSFLSFGGDILSVPEVHHLLGKIHNILDKAVIKWVGNVAHILAFPFLSLLSDNVIKSWLHSFHFLIGLKTWVLLWGSSLWPY